MGVGFGLRQATILVFSWMLPVLLRLLADVPIGREAWALYVIPAALLGFIWGLRGTVAATIVSSVLISMVALWTRTSSELWAAVVLGGVSLFIGLLFEYGRNKEAELRDMIDNLQQLVVTDSLTGVFNRRYLFDRLNAEVARARRYNLPVSVIMLDIDDFKTYNDRYGHIAGDVLLQTIAKTIRGALRQEDVVVRYGGDEFAIILTAADARSAWSTAERLRNAVKSAGMNISLGVVTYPQDATTAEELLRRADYYLLAAKAAGKDQAYALQV
ncbi:MAG: GGDEF domain-containing protein [Bacillota bacterium]|nr:GGDEF domain-containing protein [Thermoanaerobacteraceae bacterium]